MQGKPTLDVAVGRFTKPGVRDIQVQIVELLVDAGADPVGTDSVSRYTIPDSMLHAAWHYGTIQRDIVYFAVAYAVLE